jgi:branched-subunit amino acid aminotransferase/4-amino-4-deoxychorismate lyase
MYGDGLFESLRLYRGKPFDLEGHLERLQRQLSLLGFTWAPSGEVVQTILAELLSRNNLQGQDARLRLTISRGGVPGDLLPPTEGPDLEPTFSVVITPLPLELATWQRDGVAVQVMKAAFARGNFPQLKSLNYLPSLLAMRFALAKDCHEAIFIDRQGKVLEGATSNVFIVTAGSLRTAPPRLGLLAGRTRALVIDAAKSLGHSCQELAFERRELLLADEVFLTSSVREIIPVTRVDKAIVADGTPGPITRMLQEKYRQQVQDYLAASS